MHSILSEIPEDLRELLSVHSVWRMKLKRLDKFLEGHKDHIFEAYIFWLQEGFIANTTPQVHLTEPKIRVALLQSLCARLKNHGFHPQRIFGPLCDGVARLINIDDVNKVHLEQIYQEIQMILFPRAKKHQEPFDQPLVAYSNAAPSLEYPDSYTSKSKDNKEHHQAIMGPNKTDNNDIQKPRLVNISSNSSSASKLSSSHQELHHDRPHSIERSHIKYSGHETGSPPFKDRHTYGPNAYGETTLMSPSHGAASDKDSHKKYSGVYDGNEAIVHVRRQGQGSLADAIELQQGPEVQEQDTKSERRIQKSATDAPEAFKGKVERSTIRFEASHSHGSTRDQGQTKRVEKPHDDYLCYRCEVPGKSIFS